MSDFYTDRAARLDAILAQFRDELSRAPNHASPLGIDTAAWFATGMAAQFLTDGHLLLMRSGPLVDAEIKRNTEALVARLAAMTDAEIAEGPCPRFDAVMRGDARREAA